MGKFTDFINKTKQKAINTAKKEYNQQKTNYHKRKEQEKEIKQAEDAAYHAAKKEARTRKAIDKAYQQQGYYRNKKGQLQKIKPPNRKQTISTKISTFANNYEKQLLTTHSPFTGPPNNNSNNRRRRKQRSIWN